MFIHLKILSDLRNINFRLLISVCLIVFFAFGCDKIAVKENGNTGKDCPVVYYKDFDGDKFSDGITSCVKQEGYYTADELIMTYGDCDDSNPKVYPFSQTMPSGLTPQVCPPPYQQ